MRPRHLATFSAFVITRRVLARKGALIWPAADWMLILKEEIA